MLVAHLFFSSRVSLAEMRREKMVICVMSGVKWVRVWMLELDARGGWCGVLFGSENS